MSVVRVGPSSPQCLCWFGDVLTEYPVVVEDLLDEHAHCLDVEVDVESVHVQVLAPIPLLRADRAPDRGYDVA